MFYVFNNLSFIHESTLKSVHVNIDNQYYYSLYHIYIKIFYILGIISVLGYLVLQVVPAP